MINGLPFVSVIVPTTQARMKYWERIKKMYHAQDYRHKEILLDYGEGKIGEKRNRLCEKAKGDVILHMDDDDNYASNWITNSVFELAKSEADVTGLDKVQFCQPNIAACWLYVYPVTARKWLAGATFCYWKNLWLKSPFPDKQVGEDQAFIWSDVSKPKIHVHDFVEGFIAEIHPNNTSKKVTGIDTFCRYSGAEEVKIMDKWGLTILK